MLGFVAAPEALQDLLSLPKDNLMNLHARLDELGCQQKINYQLTNSLDQATGFIYVHNDKLFSVCGKEGDSFVTLTRQT